MFFPRTTVLLIVLVAAFAGTAAKKPSAELERALAAAAHARTLPKGEAYAQSVSRLLLGIAFDGEDCLGHVPGWRGFPGFQSVLIIGKTGQLKWLIRDANDPMATCVFKKIVKKSFPPPPADNWPVAYGITFSR